MNRRTVIILSAAFILGVAAISFAVLQTRDDTVRVSLESGPAASETSGADEGDLRIAVAAMISPEETFTYYQQLLDYVSEKTGRHVVLVQRQTYEEVNDLLEQGELEMAFVCTGAYIEGHDTFGMELLCAPIVNGEPVYYSYIIVPTTSDAEELEDLRGTTFAFTDPLSNTGKLVPTYMLSEMGETPESFFGKTMFTGGHDRSIEAVASGVADGAAVDSLIYDYLASTGAPAVDGTRVLAKSPPYGIPPVVVSSDLSDALKNELRDVLLGMHLDPEGHVILDAIGIDRFMLISDDAYDSVREMRDWTERNGADGG